MMKPVSLAPGDRFGSRVVLSEAKRIGPRKMRAATVKCLCGRIDDVILSDLRSGRSKMCGDCGRGSRAAIARLHALVAAAAERGT